MFSDPLPDFKEPVYFVYLLGHETPLSANFHHRTIFFFISCGELTFSHYVPAFVEEQPRVLPDVSCIARKELLRVFFDSSFKFSNLGFQMLNNVSRVHEQNFLELLTYFLMELYICFKEGLLTADAVTVCFLNLLELERSRPS